MKSKIAPYFALAAGTMLAGSSVVAGKLMSGTVPVFLSQGISLVFALMLLVPLAVYKEGGWPRVSGRDLLILILQALLSMFLFRVFMLTGLKYTSAVESGIVTGSTPAVTAVLAGLFLKERIPMMKKAGIAATVAGIVAINLAGAISGGLDLSGSLAGNLLTFLAVVGEALLTILWKSTSGKVSYVTGAMYVTLFSFAMFLPVSIFQAARFDFASAGPELWLFTAYYGIAVTAVAYICWFKGISQVSAGTAAAYTGCIPVTALVLSAAILKERITISQCAGMLLVVSGILLVSSSVANTPGLRKAGSITDKANAAAAMPKHITGSQ